MVQEDWVVTDKRDVEISELPRAAHTHVACAVVSGARCVVGLMPGRGAAARV